MANDVATVLSGEQSTKIVPYFFQASFFECFPLRCEHAAREKEVLDGFFLGATVTHW